MSILASHPRLHARILTASRVRGLKSAQLRRPRDLERTTILHRFAHDDAPRSTPSSSRIADPPRRRTTLHLRGVPPELTPANILEVFGQFGNVKDYVISTSCQYSSQAAPLTIPQKVKTLRGSLQDTPLSNTIYRIMLRMH